jgi:hypothetical protein
MTARQTARVQQAARQWRHPQHRNKFTAIMPERRETTSVD